MTSTPDSISMSDLLDFSEKASERAAEEEKLRNDGPFPNGMTEQQFHETVLDGLKDLHDANCHPMFAKVVCLELLNKLVEWHSQRANDEYANGDADCGICWARDAGKLQAAMSQIVEVMLPDDYIFRAHNS